MWTCEIVQSNGPGEVSFAVSDSMMQVLIVMAREEDTPIGEVFQRAILREIREGNKMDDPQKHLDELAKAEAGYRQLEYESQQSKLLDAVDAAMAARDRADVDGSSARVRMHHEDALHQATEAYNTFMNDPAHAAHNRTVGEQ